MNNTISIIIPTTGRKELLTQCLARVISTTRHLPVEIIVVVDKDIESRDVAQMILAASKVPYVIDYNEEYRLPVGAMNAGLKRALGDYIVGVGDDTVVESGWLDEALRIMRETFPDGDGMVGMNDCYQDGNHMATIPLLTRDFIKKHMGGVWGIPCYKKWYGDVEMTERAKAAGKYVWAEKAIARHACPESGAREYDATDLKTKQYSEEDKALCNRRRELNWPDDFEAVI